MIFLVQISRKPQNVSAWHSEKSGHDSLSIYTKPILKLFPLKYYHFIAIVLLFIINIKINFIKSANYLLNSNIKVIIIDHHQVYKTVNHKNVIVINYL